MSKKLTVTLFIFSQVNWFLLVLAPYWLGSLTTLIFCILIVAQDKKHFITEALVPALLGFSLDYAFYRTGYLEIFIRHDCVCYLLFLWINFCAIFPLIRTFVCSYKFPLILSLAPLSYLAAERLGTVNYLATEAPYIHGLIWLIYSLIIRGYFLKKGYSKNQENSEGQQL